MSEDDKSEILQNIFSDVEALKLTQAQWKGSVRILAWVVSILQVLTVAGIGWLVSELEKTNDRLEIALTVQAVTQERWGNFVTEGPRFTQKDYDQNIKSDLADLKVQRGMIESNSRRIEALEKK